MLKELVAKGYAPPKFTGEARTQLEKSVRSSVVGEQIVKNYQELTDRMMFFYQAADTVNRMTTVNIGKQLAKDFVAGDAVAKKMVSRMGRGYQAKIARAANADEVEHLIIDQLLSTTQFNYDKISLSEFGRELGPVFAVFTKWPTSIAGDIVSTMQNQNRTKADRLATVSMKYLGPLMAAGMLDYAIWGEDSGPETAREKALIGSGGFSDWMPHTALTSIASGGIMSPPMVKQGVRLLPAMLSDDEEAMARWLNDTTYAFAPGMGLVRFLGTDVPQIMLDEKASTDLIENALKGD
jgi:hypothetical protein